MEAKTTVPIRRLDGTTARATYVRHVRTLTATREGRDNDDIEVYRLEDGSEIQCISPAGDCRVWPREIDPAAGRYPGHPHGA